MKKNLFFLVFIIASCLTFGQIINPDKPEKGSWNLQMKKMWEIETAGNDVFGAIQEIDITPDGKVYILDAKNFKIFIFDKNGKFISAFGRKGEGPGEIKNLRMGAQLFSIGNNIIVVDRGRVHFFTRKGEFKRTAPYPFQTKPQTFVSEDVFISAPATIDNPRKPEAKIKLYNLKDNAEKVIATFTPFKKATVSEENRGNKVMIAIVIGDITPLMIVRYHDGKIYQGMTSQYRIHIMDLEGKPVNSFCIENREPKKISNQYKKELGKQFNDAPQDMVKKIIDGLPETASYFYNMFIDKNGMIYIFVSEPESRSRKSIDIFSPQGKYLYTSEMKVEDGLSIKTFTIWDQWLFIATEDEEGNLAVSKFSIKVPRAD